MEIIETDDLLPLGQVKLTNEQLQDLIKLGVCIIDENEEDTYNE